VNSFLQDIRFGLRVLAKNPGFTAIAVLTLALGIGANTAIFSVVNAVLLRPLPFAHSNRIVSIGESLPGFSSTMPMNAPDYRTFSERQRSFEALAVYGNRHFDLTGEGRPERVQGARISSSLFPLLGVAPRMGRSFTSGAQPGHPKRRAVETAFRLGPQHRGPHGGARPHSIHGRRCDARRVPVSAQRSAVE
jgi:hypothetical protein